MWSCFGAVCRSKIWCVVDWSMGPLSCRGVGGSLLRRKEKRSWSASGDSPPSCNINSEQLLPLWPWLTPPLSTLLSPSDVLCSRHGFQGHIDLCLLHSKQGRKLVSVGESVKTELSSHSMQTIHICWCINTTTWNSCPQCFQIFWPYLSKETWVIWNWHFFSIFFFFFVLTINVMKP